MHARLTRLCPAVALALLATGATSLHAQTSPQLAQVLSQMDQASASFKNARADVSSDVETRIGVIKDVTHDTGAMYVTRSGGKTTMGAIFKENGKVAKVVNYDGGTARVFSPGADTIDEYKAGNNQGRFDTFLTLGFGGSGKDLASAWTIKDLGPETVGGVKTEKLDLVSKDPSVVSVFTHVTVWIDPTRAVSVRQIFFSPGGETKTTNYSNIKRDTRIDSKTFEIHQDGNTRTVVH